MRWNPIEQIQDVANKFGTEERIKRFQSGELLLVERTDPRAIAVVLNFEQKVSVEARRFVAWSVADAAPPLRGCSTSCTRPGAAGARRRRPLPI